MSFISEIDLYCSSELESEEIDDIIYDFNFFDFIKQNFNPYISNELWGNYEIDESEIMDIDIDDVMNDLILNINGEYIDENKFWKLYKDLNYSPFLFYNSLSFKNRKILFDWVINSKNGRY